MAKTKKALLIEVDEDDIVWVNRLTEMGLTELDNGTQQADDGIWDSWQKVHGPTLKTATTEILDQLEDLMDTASE